MPCPVASTANQTFTDSNGVPHASPFQSQLAGSFGPLLMQDFGLIDALSHFDRERIPERVVHAKGAGALGTWTTTHDASDLSCAAFLKQGTTCPIVARFSTVGGESGSSDTARDPRGFAVKVKTEEGNWDFVGNNTPVFFLRDPAKFPLFIHTQKRNPQTNLKDKDAFWDYLSQNPESIHQVMILFGDRGIMPFAHMNGYGGHTFKWVNANSEWHYIQLHFKSDHGVKFHTAEEAAALDAANPDSGTEELFKMIDSGKFPSWTVYVQTMTFEQAKKFRYSVFDLTKVWSQKDYPLRQVGKITLNQNPTNYFAQIEQSAFSPSHLVPGMEPSNDPVLQSRLFSYPDTHRHRLGVNYQSLPVNCPVVGVSNYQRAGAMAGVDGNGGSAPNYPSSMQPMAYKAKPYSLQAISEPLNADGIQYYTSEVQDIDFEQPRDLWLKVFDDGARERFIKNVSGHLGGAKPEIIKRQLAVFARVDQGLAGRIEEAIAKEKGFAKL